VRGNHDKRAGDPGPDIDLRCVDAPFNEPPFVFAHRPSVSNEGYVLAGHVHPAARLTGAGRDSVRLPCFWVRPGVMVLPAFGEFTGTAEIAAEPDDRVWVIAEGAVIRAAG